jgi:hypothetical protein
MFDYLLTFLQVSPRFLDLVFSFGRQWQPQDFHYTAFRQENFLTLKDAETHEIPKLGRSGLEIRQCYNLWSVEKAHSSGLTWSIRQTAVYHAFDISQGRALWINIKANDIMQERISKATKMRDGLRPESLTSVSGSFAATLITHLIVFEWCAENWRLYISDLERNLDQILAKVRNAPIANVERAFSVDTNALLENVATDSVSCYKPPSRTSTFTKGISRRGDGSTFTVPPVRQLKGKLTTTNEDLGVPETADEGNGSKDPPPLGHPSAPQTTANPLPEKMESHFEILDQFSLQELQQLHGTGELLHRAGLVIKLNSEILAEVLRYYETLVRSDDVPDVIKNKNDTNIEEFFQRVRGIIRDQELEQSRIATLMGILDDGKSMVCTIIRQSIPPSDRVGRLTFISIV